MNETTPKYLLNTFGNIHYEKKSFKTQPNIKKKKTIFIQEVYTTLIVC